MARDVYVLLTQSATARGAMRFRPVRDSEKYLPQSTRVLAAKYSGTLRQVLFGRAEGKCRHGGGPTFLLYGKRTKPLPAGN